MSRKSTRRIFLQQAGAALAGTLALPRAGFAANSTLQLAMIGVGGRARALIPALGGGAKARIVAICDVDETALNNATQGLPQARQYRDWRELLASEGDRIDAVCIATPDHSHAPPALAALLKGKHVYCEKPLAHEIYEARSLAYLAQKAGVVTQLGIQIHAHPAYREAVRLLQDGAIGNVKEWHSWSNAQYTYADSKRPEGEDVVPDHLDWELWIGAAPMRPYKKDVYHPGRWRCWQDFGTGAIGDFGCHIMDPIFTALGLGAPLSVMGETSETGGEAWRSWSVVHYEFPGTPLTAGNTIRATWYDGGKRPDRDAVALLPADAALPDAGSIIIGEDGVMVLPHYDAAQLYPREKFSLYPRPEVQHLNHYTQWSDACRGEGKTDADFVYGGALTEAVLLGGIALRVPEKKLEWDTTLMRITNVPEANKLLYRRYRNGWELPEYPIEQT